MNNSIAISVIVPIYNAEKYLDKSLSSLTQQTFQDFEVLLINDGSKDNSAAICKKYSLIDQRFKLFNKENGGSASARQMGMDNLCGRYCIVCDADDWVEANMLEQLYLATNNEQVDMVISDFFVDYDNGKQRIISHKGIDLKQESLVRGLLCQKIMGSTNNKLIRSELFRKFQISYLSGINMGEDLLVVLKLLQHPLSITYCKGAYYHYFRSRNNGSYTNTPNASIFYQLAEVNKWKYEHFSLSEYEEELFLSSINLAFTGLRAKGLSKEEYRAFLLKELPLQRLRKHSCSNLKTLLILLSSISYPAAKAALNLMYRFVYK